MCAEYHENIFFPTDRPSNRPPSTYPGRRATTRRRRACRSTERARASIRRPRPRLASRVSCSSTSPTDEIARSGIVFICPHRRASARTTRHRATHHRSTPRGFHRERACAYRLSRTRARDVVERERGVRRARETSACGRTNGIGVADDGNRASTIGASARERTRARLCEEFERRGARRLGGDEVVGARDNVAVRRGHARSGRRRGRDGVDEGDASILARWER